MSHFKIGYLIFNVFLKLLFIQGRSQITSRFRGGGGGRIICDTPNF